VNGGETEAEVAKPIEDANGNALYEGDKATLIEELKLKGSSRVAQG